MKMARSTLQAHAIVAHKTNEFFWIDFLNTLKQINGDSIDMLGNTFIDGGSVQLPEEYIAFMKETKLHEIEFENTEELAFNIKNKRSNRLLPFSNRDSTKGELRGERLRQKIMQMSQINPNLSLYDAISSVIRSPEESDLYTYFITRQKSLLDETTLLILMNTAKAALSQLAQKTELSEESLTSLYNQQYQLYFENAPTILQPLSKQLQATGDMLRRLKEKCEAKIINTQAQNTEELTQLKNEVTQLNNAIIKTYELMPAYYHDGRINFPENYSQRVQEYSATANQLANNPHFMELAPSGYFLFTMLALCAIALATLTAVLAFPPAALFLSQVALHGALSVGAIEGVLASTGVAAAGIGAGFFAAGTKISAEEKMRSLESITFESTIKMNSPIM